MLLFTRYEDCSFTNWRALLCTWEGQQTVELADLMDRWSPAAAGQSTPVCFAPRCKATSNPASDKPPSPILKTTDQTRAFEVIIPSVRFFFLTVRGDIFGPKLTFCCFCAAVPRHQLSVREWSTGSCEGFSPQRSKYPATGALYRAVLLLKKYISARNLHKNITENYLKR